MSTDPNTSSNEHMPAAMVMLESMPNPMTIYDRSGLMTAANPAFAAMFAVPREAIKQYHIYHDPSTVENGFRAAFELALQGEQVALPVRELDPSHYGMPGKKLWLTSLVFPFTNAAGEIEYVGATYQDITVQVEAEQERLSLTTRLAQHARDMLPFYTLAENAPDCFVLTDMDVTILFANPAFKRTFGDLVGKKIFEAVIDRGPEWQDEWRYSLANTGTWMGESDCRRHDGVVFPAHHSITLIRDETGHPIQIAGIIRDISGQRQAELERVALQEEIILTQQAAIRELSSPLIPLADGIVVMPLVGTIDSRRAQGVMETLLEGISAYQAEIVLLDISGVRVVDTQVADALLRTARAVQLLGAQVVLTGISAEIAQTIVHLGADMSQIMTQANLQAGLRYALASTGIKL